MPHLQHCDRTKKNVYPRGKVVKYASCNYFKFRQSAQKPSLGFSIP